jgi:uncharacterized protein YnzC (UPF0291/DUF896 family)
MSDTNKEAQLNERLDMVDKINGLAESGEAIALAMTIEEVMEQVDYKYLQVLIYEMQNKFSEIQKIVRVI